VAIPRVTIAVDITANARTPGTRKSMGLSRLVLAPSTLAKKTSTPIGIPTVTSRLSARRTVSRNSTRVWPSSVPILIRARRP